MRKVSIWASGLLASAIPFVFVGAVIVLGACIFEAVGQQPADSSAPFHAAASPSEQVLTVASVDTLDDVAQRQPDNYAYGNAPHHDASPPIKQTFAPPIKQTPHDQHTGAWPTSGRGHQTNTAPLDRLRRNLGCNSGCTYQLLRKLFNYFKDENGILNAIGTRTSAARASGLRIGHC